MAGKIQRNNKTNKVSKKAKHARRTRRVSRKNNKSLNKRKQRKGGDFSLGIFKDRCNMNERTYNIEDKKNGEQITEGVFKSDDDNESIKITRICRDDNGKITFVTDNKDKKRISMEDLIKDYPKYQPPLDGGLNEDERKKKEIPIKYYFDKNDGFNLKDKNPIERAKTNFNKFKRRIFGL